MKSALNNKSPSHFYRGYFINNELAGLINASKESSSVTIYQLYVLPKHQRKGIGTELINELVRYYGLPISIMLKVEEKDTKGVAFYKKYGFSFPRRAEVIIDDFVIPCLEAVLELGKN
ncbi:MAG: GNAT family N-acetyltransferase [Conexivisphaerales archaeon]